MEISKMEKEIKLVKWQEFKPYNQVLYGDDIALITGYKQAERYPISVIHNGHTRCYDIEEKDLTPIKLDAVEKILQKLHPNKVTPFECVFSAKDEQNKVSITFCNNFCSVIKNGEVIYSGIVSEFHVLQNILNDVFGYTIYLTEAMNI